MFNFRLLVSPSFWFSTQWNPVTTQTIWLMVAVFAMLLIAGIVILVLAGRGQDQYAARRLRSVSGPLFFGGGAGLFFTFVLAQQIPILSARFWFLILFISVTAWLFLTIRGFVVQVPKQRAASRARDEFTQYLPKRRKK